MVHINPSRVEWTPEELAANLSPAQRRQYAEYNGVALPEPANPVLDAVLAKMTPHQRRQYDQYNAAYPKSVGEVLDDARKATAEKPVDSPYPAAPEHVSVGTAFVKAFVAKRGPLAPGPDGPLPPRSDAA